MSLPQQTLSRHRQAPAGFARVTSRGSPNQKAVEVSSPRPTEKPRAEARTSRALPLDWRYDLRNLLSEAQVVGIERRKTPRYPFKAFAELRKEGVTEAVTTKISELSLHGCYIEKTNPFPVGLTFHIKIFTDREFFESSATVVYSQPELGMGVTFYDIRPAYVRVLRKWLLDAMMMKKPGTAANAPRDPNP
jgi:hypothetical protein